MKKKKTHLVLIKLTCGRCQCSCVRELCGRWNLHCQTGCILCGGSSRSEIWCSSKWSINVRWWHTLILFFGFCLDFKFFFNIQVQVYFFVYFFRSHNQPKHIKKRVKIKKLVSKNLPKKIPRARDENFMKAQ